MVGSGTTIQVFLTSNQNSNMKIFPWNIRGLTVASKHRVLRKKLHQEKEDIVMLQETKCDSRYMELIARKIWNSCDLICSEVDGASGGLSLLWNPNKFKVELVSQSNRIIIISYKILGLAEKGFVTNVCGHQMSADKRDFLSEISSLGLIMKDQQWIVGGDFNLITTLEDKKGGI